MLHLSCNYMKLRMRLCLLMHKRHNSTAALPIFFFCFHSKPLKVVSFILKLSLCAQSLACRQHHQFCSTMIHGIHAHATQSCFQTFLFSLRKDTLSNYPKTPKAKNIENPQDPNSKVKERVAMYLPESLKIKNQ
ncbi:hypothetical protein AAHE18_05G237600 [Arachis hypogaea]